MKIHSLNEVKENEEEDEQAIIRSQLDRGKFNYNEWEFPLEI